MINYQNCGSETQSINEKSAKRDFSIGGNRFESVTDEPRYALEKQNFKQAKIVSAILSFMLIILYLLPIPINNEMVKLNSGTTFLYLLSGLIVGTIALAIWQVCLLLKYLRNFYHPLSNIFTDIKGAMIAMLLLMALILVSVSTHMSLMMQNGMMSIFIAFYVLWAFMQIMAGWILIDSYEEDFVGGLSTLGYALLVSGIIPLLIIFVPLLVSNVFINASRYSNKYGFLD